MPYAEHAGARLFYQTEGEGDPVAFLMGFGASLDWWFPQMLVFPRHFRMLTFDPRGVGKSEADDREINMELLADDLAAILDAAGIERTHVVGLSYGGMVAQEFALRHPDRLDKLVLCSTNPGGEHAVQPEGDTVSLLINTLMIDQPDDPDTLLTIMGGTLFPQAYLAEHREDVLDLLRESGFSPAGAPVLMRQMEAVMGHDTHERLASVAHPCLIMTGDEDVLVPPANAQVLADRLPNARLVLLPGAGHCAHIQVPDAYNKAILDFLTA